MGRTLAAAALLYLASLSPVIASSPPVTFGDASIVKRQIAEDRGHVVLLNFWATWCPQCVAEYPSLVRLDRSFGPRGLRVIAVSLDLRDDIPDKIKPFLTRVGARFPQFVLDQSDPEKEIDAFDPLWQGDLPRTFIYSKSGKLVAVLPDQQTYRKFVSAIKTGLKSK